jgi:hypothetical protein
MDVFDLLRSLHALPDDPSNVISLQPSSNIPLPQIPNPLSSWLIEGLSAYQDLSSLSLRPQDLPDDTRHHPSLLPGVPAHHFLDHDDPRLRLGLENGSRPGPRLWCLGGNKYSYDGFFVGRCRCVRSAPGDVSESESELWNFEFAPPSMDGLDAAAGISG